MTIELTTQIRIQEHKDYWYTVEDIHFDVGCDGCTISYWEFVKDAGDKRLQHICMGKLEALVVADAIYKLFKKN
jgi:hypothetical protein